MKENRAHQRAGKKGAGLVEVIIATAVISSALWALGTIAVYTLNIVELSGARVRAAFLAGEGLEAVRNIRDSGWDAEIATLAASTTFYLSYDDAGERWRATSTAVVVDGFTRSFALYHVYRDANDDISASGTLDPGTKKATVWVSWMYRDDAYEESITTYFADIIGN